MSSKELVCAVSVCPKLEEFLFCETYHPNTFDSDVAVALSVHCPHLKLFHISNNNSIDSDMVLTLVKESPNLQDISFNNCFGIDDAALGHVARNCPHLTDLFLRITEQVTNVGIGYIAFSCTNLTSLSLIVCARVTNIDTVLQNCRNLSTLVTMCTFSAERLTPLLFTVARECANLSCIRLCCSSVQAPGLLEVISRCPKLRHLDVSSCPSLRSDLPMIKARCDERGIECVTDVNPA
jgi:hypothetical protein